MLENICESFIHREYFICRDIDILWYDRVISDSEPLSHYTLRAICGAVYCNRSCLWVCLCVCGWVGGCVPAGPAHWCHLLREPTQQTGPDRKLVPAPPRPRWGSLQHSPRLPSWIWGAYFYREGGEGEGLRRGVGSREERGEGRGEGPLVLAYTPDMKC